MFFDVLFVGIMVGAIYTLVTIGYSMVYSILKLMNFGLININHYSDCCCFSSVCLWFFMQQEIIFHQR